MAKAKALPKGVIDYRGFFNRLNNEPDTLTLILLYGEEQYLIDGALKTAKKKFISDGGDTVDFNLIDTRRDGFHASLDVGQTSYHHQAVGNNGQGY